MGDGWHTAAGAHHVVEYLFSPQTVRLPLTPAHCPGVLIWRGRMVPMIDLTALLPGPAPGAEARTRAVILAYQAAPGEPLRYGALRVQGAPIEIRVSDDSACPLPDEPVAFRYFSRSCFAYRDRPVPVLDVMRLFTRALPEPPPNREPDAIGPRAGDAAVAAATDEPGATEGPVFAPQPHPTAFTSSPAPIAAASDDDDHALQPIIAWDTFTPMASATGTTAGVDPAASPLQPDRAQEPCAAEPQPVPPAAPLTSAVPVPTASDELERIMQTVAAYESFEAIAPAVERIDPLAFPMMPDLAQEPLHRRAGSEPAGPAAIGGMAVRQTGGAGPGHRTRGAVRGAGFPRFAGAPSRTATPPPGRAPRSALAGAGRIGHRAPRWWRRGSTSASRTRCRPRTPRPNRHRRYTTSRRRRSRRSSRPRPRSGPRTERCLRARVAARTGDDSSMACRILLATTLLLPLLAGCAGSPDRATGPATAEVMHPTAAPSTTATPKRAHAPRARGLTTNTPAPRAREPEPQRTTLCRVVADAVEWRQIRGEMPRWSRPWRRRGGERRWPAHLPRRLRARPLPRPGTLRLGQRRALRRRVRARQEVRARHDLLSRQQPLRRGIPRRPL
ncbi:MAG: chemotaxis protein CheW [Chromatiales bacterium]|nr:chemotaxis protein CheW [Chromatiales bacterium]